MAEYRFLLVEDQESVRKSLVAMLDSFDVDIIEASNGKEGVEVLAKDPAFDLIITDIDMPQMDGIEFCTWLKAESVTQAIPIIIVSSFDSDIEIDRGFQVGASAYVSKGEVKELLPETVTNILSESTFRRSQRVLVVDDSALIRKVLLDALLQDGFQVVTAEHGKHALDVLHETDVDLILSDIMMPKMDGYALCEAVKKDPRLAPIPFIAMSVKEKRRHMKKSIQRGAAAYIVKPFRIDELIILIERILSDQFLLLLKEKENLTMERDMILAGITSLINALEARDSYTKGHSESVATIVTGMAELGGMDQKKIERLTFGARLHDIGKIGVPDALLFKRGKLTKDEYDQIKLHSEMGSNILAPIPSLADVLPLVMHHHERFDGRGYPHGLKGEEIPLWARMTDVAEAFDSMSSDRPYRKGMEFEHIMMVIKDVRGSQLCPDCVDLFLKWTLANGFPVQHPRGLHFDPS